MKKTIIALAAIVALYSLSSCDKEVLTPGNNLGTEAKTVIHASTENSQTRTALSGSDTDGYDVVWSEGDQIRIGSATFTLSEGAGTTSGTFTGPALADGTYTAYYGTTDGTVPTSQTCTAGSISYSPMRAEVSVKDGVPGNASFTNIGGLLRLTISKVKEMTVGDIYLNANYNSKSVRMGLSCANPVSISAAGTEFYMALPAGTYTDVTIEFGDMTKSLPSSSSLIIERSKITKASFKTDSYNGHKFVDLGLSVFWATCNVGARTPDQYGSYFSWGNVQSGTPESAWTWTNYKWGSMESQTKYNATDNKLTLDSEDDAACEKWESPWRMPTREEMKELISGCHWVYEENYENTGEKGYRVYRLKESGSYSPSDPHIFLPFAGKFIPDKDGKTQYYNPENAEEGYYWSSTYRSFSNNVEDEPAISNYKASSMYFTESNGSADAKIFANSRCEGLTIRPVISK